MFYMEIMLGSAVEQGSISDFRQWQFILEVSVNPKQLKDRYSQLDNEQLKYGPKKVQSCSQSELT